VDDLSVARGRQFENRRPQRNMESVTEFKCSEHFVMAGRRHCCGGDEIAWQGTVQFFLMLIVL
jgi:hypothetical protein